MSSFLEFYFIYVCVHVYTHTHTHIYMGLPSGSSGKEPACQCRRPETWVQSLGREDPLEEGIATHSSILAVHGVTRSQTWLKWLSMCVYIYTHIYLQKFRGIFRQYLKPQLHSTFVKIESCTKNIKWLRILMNNVQKHHCQPRRTYNIINNINYSEKIFLCYSFYFYLKIKTGVFLKTIGNCLTSVSSICEEEGRRMSKGLQFLCTSGSEAWRCLVDVL